MCSPREGGGRGAHWPILPPCRALPRSGPRRVLRVDRGLQEQGQRRGLPEALRLPHLPHRHHQRRGRRRAVRCAQEHRRARRGLLRWPRPGRQHQGRHHPDRPQGDGQVRQDVLLGRAGRHLHGELRPRRPRHHLCAPAPCTPSPPPPHAPPPHAPARPHPRTLPHAPTPARRRLPCRWPRWLVPASGAPTCCVVPRQALVGATASAPRLSPRARARGTRSRPSCSTARSCRAPSPPRTSPPSSRPRARRAAHPPPHTRATGCGRLGGRLASLRWRMRAARGACCPAVQGQGPRS